jgi:NADH-quinone oxidoreductase subunit N
MWPEFLLAIFGIVIVFMGLSIKSTKALGGVSLFVIILSLVLVWDMLGFLELVGLNLGLYGDAPVNENLYDGALRVDPYSLFFKMVFLIVAGLVTIASMSYIKDNEPHKAEFFALLLFATIGMMLVATAGDLVVLYIGIELAGLSSYALVAFRKTNKKGAEAAVKYMIIGSVASAVMLYGISLIYGLTQTTDIYELPNHFKDDQPAVFIAVVFLAAGFGFKLAAVPFHAWAPDTYEGAPAPITVLLASGSKKMGVAALFKVFFVGLMVLKVDIQLVFAVLAILTMTVGNMVALVQKDIKRMLAYSSIAQAGYILIALAVGTERAAAAGMFHVLTHAFMKGGAFFCVAILTYNKLGRNIEDFRGLRKRAPFTALALTIFLLSLAGIPPLGGFWSKVYLFASAVEPGGWIVWLAVIGLLNSALSLYYYARVIKYMYVLPQEKKQKTLKEPAGLVAVIFLALFGTILTGLAPGTFLSFAATAASMLGF